MVPSLMAAAAGVLAMAATWGDLRLAEVDPAEMPVFVFVSTPNGARDVLSTLLSSMITMTSLVFSITMVVLSLAASQFGPRLIRSFMSSPHTQFVLGTFIMTSVYCLIELGSVGSTIEDAKQAFPSVSLGLLLVLISVLVLVSFIHFLARSIVSETLIKRLGMEVTAMVGELDDLPEDRNHQTAAALPEDFEREAISFGPRADGFVQSIDLDGLKDLAEGADVLIAFAFRSGDYVISDGGGISVCPGQNCTPELQERICRMIVIGSRRTATQDPEFAIRHLVEMAVRALSPGVNDPYTAAAVLAQLSAGLAHLMKRALPESLVTGADGRLRIVIPSSTYASVIGAAFNQIRQNAAGKPFVILHLVEAILRIADHVRLPEQCDALEGQLDAALDAANGIDEFDRQAILARAAEARTAIDAARRRAKRAPSAQRS
ncbi:DUF2254 domain-containing protein [Rhizobium sp. TRM95001]|nr:DUF2254 domain-containing protein [Rhizobium halophilum]